MRPVVRVQLDYYAVLEILSSADTAEVNAAFRRLAWRYHPDRNPAPGATLQFQDINEAHQVLSDPTRRAEYDARWHPHAGRNHRASPPGMYHRPRRRWHRHSHARAVLLALFAMLLVSSAWVVIFTAMTAAHSAGPLFSFYDLSSPTVSGGSTECGISLEMYPVTYIDQRGHKTTGWDAVAHNCYTGETHLSGLSQPTPRRIGRFVNDPEAY